MRVTTKYRQHLSQPGIIISPVIYDPFTAKIAEAVGFECAGIGGYSMGAHTTLSEPLISLDEAARFTRSITSVCNLALKVDAGAGYGEPLHVMHTVRMLEAAGAACLQLEDQAFPKRVSYHRAMEEIIPIEDMVLKIKAAVEARVDPDLTICGRTDSFRTHGYDEAIKRSRAYMEAGADMMMLFPNTEEEIKSAPKDLPGVPLFYVNSSGNRFNRPVVPARQLEEWGWKGVSDAISTVNVICKAVRELYLNLKNTGESGLEPDEIREVRDISERIIGLQKLYDIEGRTVLKGKKAKEGHFVED